MEKKFRVCRRPRCAGVYGHKEGAGGRLARVCSTFGVCSCFERLFLIWRVLICWRKQQNLSWDQCYTRSTYPTKKKNILVPVLFQLSLKFLPLSPHGHLSELPGSFRSDKSIGFGFKERSSLSLRATRRCYWAAAWTGNFRGLTHTYCTRPPLHLGSTQRNERLNNERCWWTLVLEAAIIQKCWK